MDGLIATTSTIAAMIIIMMTAVRAVAKIMAVIIMIVKAVRIDHDKTGSVKLYTIVTKTRYV